MSSTPPISVLILGYGSQTTGIADNLLERGCEVVIGNRQANVAAGINSGYKTSSVDVGNSENIHSDLEAARLQWLGRDRYFNVVIYHCELTGLPMTYLSLTLHLNN